MRNGKILIRKTGEKGSGVFANFDITKGELIHVGKPLRLLKNRTSHSFQINDNTHVQLDKISRSINHSCDPNMGIKSNSFSGYDFVAIKDIQRGGELTWDYETTEYESIAVAVCLCETKLCRGKTNGFKYLPFEVVMRYGEYIADYLKRKIYYNQREGASTWKKEFYQE